MSEATTHRIAVTFAVIASSGFLFGIESASGAVVIPAEFDASATAAAGNQQASFSSSTGPDIFKTVYQTYSIGTPIPTVGSGSATTMVDALDKPVVATDTTGSSTGLDDYYVTASGMANAELQYYFEVGGPTPSVQLQIQAVGYFTIGPVPEGGGAQGLISLSVDGPGLDIADVATAETANPTAIVVSGVGTVSGNREQGYTGNINRTSTMTVDTDQLYTVDIDAYSYATASPDAPYIYSEAFLDPYFSIVSDDPEAYTLEFSPGVGNSPLSAAVPEPSTWAMMLAGFAGLGFVTFRRSRKSAVGIAPL
jgi:hypothetical protein